MKNTIAALGMITLSTLPAVGQDAHTGHDMPNATEAQLPAICQTASTSSSDDMQMTHEMDEAHSALMAGMNETNQQMMDAMMVEDIDVAFVCGMIPHHQAAINMAKAELAHGDNAWAKDMAQKIIDAQEAEIYQMTTWLQDNAADE